MAIRFLDEPAPPAPEPAKGTVRFLDEAPQAPEATGRVRFLDEAPSELKPSFLEGGKETAKKIAVSGLAPLAGRPELQPLPAVPTLPEGPLQAAKATLELPIRTGATLAMRGPQILDVAGERAAEALGERGLPKTGAAVGTAISLAPDIALSASALKGILLRGAKSAASASVSASAKGMEQAAKKAPVPLPAGEKRLLLPAPKPPTEGVGFSYREPLATDVGPVGMRERPRELPFAQAVRREPVIPFSQAKKIARATERGGGATFHPTQGDLAGTPNYAVSLFPERTQIVTKLDPREIQRFAEKNKDLLADPRNSIGTWFNREEKKVYLDITTTIPDRDAAIAAGKKANQIAIFDLASGAEIPIGGTGRIPPGLATPADRLADVPLPRTTIPNLPPTISPDGQARLERLKNFVREGQVTDLPKGPLATLRTARLEPIRVFEEAKVPGGVLKEQQAAAADAMDVARKRLISDIREAEQFGFREGSAESSAIQELGEGRLTPERAIAQFGPEKAAKMGEALKYLRIRYDEYLDAVNGIRLKRGMDAIPRRSDFFSHFQEMSLLDETLDLFTRKSAKALMDRGKEMLSDLQLKSQMLRKFKNVIFAHTSRPEGLPFTSDAIGGFIRYSRSANRFVHMQPLVDEIFESAKLLRKGAPRLATYLEDWGSFMAGKAQFVDVALRKTVGPEMVDVASQLSSGFVSGVVEGNPSVVLAQLFGLPVVAAENGLVRTAASLAARVINPEVRTLALANSRVLRDRLLDAEETLLRRGKLRTALSVPMFVADREIVMAGWIGTFQNNVQKGTKVAMRLADEFVAKSQGWTSIVNKPTLLRSQTFQKFFPLQNQATAFVNTVWEDLIKRTATETVRGEAIMRNANRVLSFAGTYAAVSAIKYAATGRSSADIGDFFPLLRLTERPGGVFGALANAGQKFIRGDISGGTKKIAETLFLASGVPAPLQILKTMKAVTKEPKKRR